MSSLPPAEGVYMVYSIQFMERVSQNDAFVGSIQNTIAGLTDREIDTDHVYFQLPDDEIFHRIRLLDAPLKTLQPLHEALDSALKALPEDKSDSDPRSFDLIVCRLHESNEHPYGIAIRPDADLRGYNIDPTTGLFLGRKAKTYKGRRVGV